MTDKREWNGRSRGGATGYSIFVWVLRHIGLRAAYALLWIVVPYFVLFAPSGTRSSWLYQRNILKRNRIQSSLGLFKHFYLFGQVLIDRIAIKNGFKDQYEYEYDGKEKCVEVIKGGRGTFIVGAHFGAWEIGQQFFDEVEIPFNIVMLDAEWEKIKHAIEKHAKSKLFKAITLTADNGLEVVLQMKQAFDGGEIVGMLGDRFLNDEQSEPIDFMGHNAHFPLGMYKIAAKLEVPAVFYHATKLPRKNGKERYKFSFYVKEPTKNADEIRKTYVSVLEQKLKEAPFQWFNFYNFWQI
ncbi:MAG: acyltransferase [Marinilabiliaceae bacterium]|nr:acyltransferase [Marinilabiliaceae bacterium]